jgi:hypothetical protein
MLEILYKILGVILLALGGFFVILGPGNSDHQNFEFGIGSIIAGIVMALVGLYLLLS